MRAWVDVFVLSADKMATKWKFPLADEVKITFLDPVCWGEPQLTDRAGDDRGTAVEALNLVVGSDPQGAQAFAV